MGLYRPELRPHYRKESCESSKNRPVKEKQCHYAPDVPRSQKRYESDQDCDSNNSKWGYSEPDEPRSFETQSNDRKRKEKHNTPFTGMERSGPDQERRRTTSEKAGQSYHNNNRSDTRPPPRAERRNRDHRKDSKRNRRGDIEGSSSDDDDEGNKRG